MCMCIKTAFLSFSVTVRDANYIKIGRRRRLVVEWGFLPASLIARGICREFGLRIRNTP